MPREAEDDALLLLEVETLPADDALPLEAVAVPAAEELLLRTLLTAVPRDAVPDDATREADVLLDDDTEEAVDLELCTPLLTEDTLFPLLMDERELLEKPLPVPREPKCTGVPPPCPNAGPPGNGSGCPGP